MTVAKVYLENEPLNNLEGFTWGLKEGVLPMRSSVLLTNAQADKILQSATNKSNSKFPYLNLKFIVEDGRGGHSVVSFQNIVVTGYGPSETEPLNFTRIFLADNRYFWEFGYVDARFNMRTQVGDKASVDRVYQEVYGNIPRDTYDVISYRSYSLTPPVSKNEEIRDKRPWTLDEIMKEIMVGDGPQSLKNQIFPTEVFFSQTDLRDLGVHTQLFEEITLRGNHKSCLADLLMRVPYVGVYVDYLGGIRFYNKGKGQETDILNATDIPFVSGSSPKYINNSYSRPRSIVFLFDTECELRFDYQDRGSPSGSFVQLKPESRNLFNVIPVPVPVLENISITTPKGNAIINGVKDQWLPFDAVRSALALKYEQVDLSFDILRRDYVFPGWIHSMKYYAESLTVDPYITAPWDSIMNGLKSHYRRSFRINPIWQAKMVNIQDKRVTLFDPTAGATAPSPIYMNYAYWVTTKGFLANWNVNPNVVEVFKNVKTWKDDNPNYYLNGVVPMPFGKISMINSENGIFTIQLEAFDPSGFIKKDVFPSLIENPPTHDYAARQQPNYLDEADEQGRFPQLASDHFMSVILSATPAPSISAAYYSIAVTPYDVPSDKVSPSKISKPLAPTMYVKIDAKNAVARIKWDDIEEEENKSYSRLFGVGDVQPVFPPTLKDFIVNKEYLVNLAIAKGTEIYSRGIDRYMGSKITTVASNLELKGSIDELPITIATNGTPSMEIKMNEELKVPTFENLLDPNTKAFIFGQVQKGI